MQYILIHRPNIPYSYSILFFTASDFTFTTRHIHNWTSFLLWPSLFILSRAISVFLPIWRVCHAKCWARWLTSWNQDCQEKYQQPQIWRLYHSHGKKQRELKRLLMRVNEESEKAGLKLSIQKTKIMASSPITSWQTDWEKVVTVTDFIFLGSKIIVDGNFSCKIKRHLLLGRKAMTNVDSILKSRDITLPTKVHIVKTVVFWVIMYRSESWTVNKAECRGIDTFEL